MNATDQNIKTEKEQTHRFNTLQTFTKFQNYEDLWFLPLPFENFTYLMVKFFYFSYKRLWSQISQHKIGVKHRSLDCNFHFKFMKFTPISLCRPLCFPSNMLLVIGQPSNRKLGNLSREISMAQERRGISKNCGWRAYKSGVSEWTTIFLFSSTAASIISSICELF